MAKTKTDELVLDLAKLVVTDSLETTVMYKHGIKFRLRYISKAALHRLIKSCTDREWSAKLKQTTLALNNDKFVAQFCAMAVLDWEGATVSALKKMMPFKTTGLKQADMDKPVTYSQDNLVTLMKNSMDLDEFLQNSATEAGNFDIPTEEELGNSEPSQSGS